MMIMISTIIAQIRGPIILIVELMLLKLLVSSPLPKLSPTRLTTLKSDISELCWHIAAMDEGHLCSITTLKESSCA